MSFEKLKRVVIKEELVAITGDFVLAVILNQFLYWSERVKDFDKMIVEEKTIAGKEGIEYNLPLKSGWIYKKAEELIEETMINISPRSMRDKIKALEEMGFLKSRLNPMYKWDRTKQYRVNFKILREKLIEAGYELQGYKTLETLENIERQNFPKHDENISTSSGTDCRSMGNNCTYKGAEFAEQYQRLYTETTTNIKKEINKEKNKKEKKQEVENLPLENYRTEEEYVIEKIKKFQDKEISEKLLAIMENRKRKTKPITKQVYKMLQDRLHKFSKGNRDILIEILDQSVSGGYCDVFELKQSNKYNNFDVGKSRSYDLNEYENTSKNENYDSYLNSFLGAI